MDSFSFQPVRSASSALPTEESLDKVTWLILKIESMFLYGSLTRPPDVIVTSMILTSFSRTIGYRTISFAGGVAYLRFVERRDVSRDLEIWLESFKQILQFPVDRRWLDFWIVNHVLPLTKSDLRMFSSECIKDTLILVNHLCHPTLFCLSPKTYIDCIAALLISVSYDDVPATTYVPSQGEIWLNRTTFLVNLIRKTGVYHRVVLQCQFGYEASRQFGYEAAHTPSDSFSAANGIDVVCASLSSFLRLSHGFQEYHNLIQQMEISFASCCFLLASLCACYSRRQGELLSSRTNVLGALIHKVACAFAGQRLLHSSASHITFPFPCYIGFIEEFLRFEEVFFVCFSPGCCYLDHVVRIPQELLLRQSLLHQLPKCFFTHSVIIWNQVILSLCQKCDCGAGNCWLQHCDLFLRQRWWLHLLHIGFFRMKKIISVDFPVFLHKQSRDIAFFGHIIAANSGWFGSFLTFFYGSSPRPPDDHYALGVNFLKFTWSSQDLTVSSPRWKFLPS